jgi:hypothetical protein
VTDRRRATDSQSEDRSSLVRFRAEVARLSGLPAEDFAALDPDALPALIATIRATSSEAPPS